MIHIQSLPDTCIISKLHIMSSLLEKYVSMIQMHLSIYLEFDLDCLNSLQINVI